MSGDRFYGKYRATVVNDVDPEQLLRVQVNVPEVGVEGLWALPCLPPGYRAVPPTGAGVWVEFEGGDPDLPIWTGSWWTEPQPPTDGGIEVRKGPTTLRVAPEGVTVNRWRHKPGPPQ